MCFFLYYCNTTTKPWEIFAKILFTKFYKNPLSLLLLDNDEGSSTFFVVTILASAGVPDTSKEVKLDYYMLYTRYVLYQCFMERCAAIQVNVEYFIFSSSYYLSLYVFTHFKLIYLFICVTF